MQTVRAFPLRVGVGEVRADVAEARGAEKRVAERVGEHVAIGVADRTFVERDFERRRS